MARDDDANAALEMRVNLYDRDDMMETRIYFKINNIGLTSLASFDVSSAAKKMHRVKNIPRDQHEYAKHASPRQETLSLPPKPTMQTSPLAPPFVISTLIGWVEMHLTLPWR